MEILIKDPNKMVEPYAGIIRKAVEEMVDKIDVSTLELIGKNCASVTDKKKFNDGLKFKLKLAGIK